MVGTLTHFLESFRKDLHKVKAERQGTRESTVRSSVKALKAVAKRIDLLNPEFVKAYLAMSDQNHRR
jgi:hypothetical protein